MGLRRLSDEDLSISQIEEISDAVTQRVPEFREYSRKNLEAFTIQKEIEGSGRLN